MGWFSSSKNKDKTRLTSSSRWNVFDPPTAYRSLVPTVSPHPQQHHHHHHHQQRLPTHQQAHQYSYQYHTQPPLQPAPQQQLYIYSQHSHQPHHPPHPPHSHQPHHPPHPHHPHHPHHQLLSLNHQPSRPQLAPQLSYPPALPWPHHPGPEAAPAPRPATAPNTTGPRPRPSPVRDAYDTVAARLDDALARTHREQAHAPSPSKPRPPPVPATDRPRPGSHSSFAKVDLYANSKLPATLPALALRLPAWPLLCLAARHASLAYASSPSPDLIDADWRAGTKAMLVRAVPAPHRRARGRATVIVVAVRGSTASFTDWAVNLASAPAAPRALLDHDPTNLCHAGFLAVARATLRPLAARLRHLLLLAEDADGETSLLLTGHSAGGAVAALLHAHMHAPPGGAAGSELAALTPRFRRVHCVTFGAPPVSLRPLRARGARGLFLGVVNEGDPVARADAAYVRSLLELLTSPSPDEGEPLLYGTGGGARRRGGAGREEGGMPRWPVPGCALSNAGRVVVLRAAAAAAPGGGERSVEERLAEEGVRAVTCGEEALRGVIWGDPVAHAMSLYEGRIEALAKAAVTGRMQVGGGGGRLEERR